MDKVCIDQHLNVLNYHIMNLGKIIYGKLAA